MQSIIFLLVLLVATFKTIVNKFQNKNENLDVAKNTICELS
jgi:hypothetical protein